jgi:hypothetical protein
MRMIAARPLAEYGRADAKFGNIWPRETNIV